MYMYHCHHEYVTGRAIEMASKGRSMYYEFLYPKICIGAPIHLCSLLFAGTAGALALVRFVCQGLYTEKVVRQKTSNRQLA